MPQVQWTKERMKYAMCFFPLIGAVIGLMEYGAILLFRTMGFPFLAQILPVVIPVAVTGGIHMDGLLDVIDAKSSHVMKQRKSWRYSKSPYRKPLPSLDAQSISFYIWHFL